MNITNHCHPHGPYQPWTYVAPRSAPPVRCPVCEGTGSKPAKFYPPNEPNLLRRPDGRVVCKSCYGAGYLWTDPAPAWPTDIHWRISDSMTAAPFDATSVTITTDAHTAAMVQ